MQRRLVRIISVFISLFVLALLLIQIEVSEPTRPFHTIAYTQASFPHSHDSVNVLVKKLNKKMQETGTTSYLTVPDQKDGVNGVRSYWLGARPSHSLTGAAWGTLDLSWMRLGRYGTLEPLNNIGTRSPAGTYSFSTLSACRYFSVLAPKLGGQSVMCQVTPFRGWALFPSGYVDGPTELLSFVALLLLGICFVWAYDGSLSRSQAIRLQAGTSLGRICWQDSSHLIALQIIPFMVVWIISCIYISITRRHMRPILNWTLASFLSILLMMIFLGLVCALATFILHPRVLQLARRQNNLLVLAGGTETLTVLCLAFSLVATSIGLSTVAVASRQRQSALVWSHASTALKVQLRTTVGKPVPLDDYHPFIRRMLAEGSTAFSLSDGNHFIDQSRTKPQMAGISEAGGNLSLPGGYDDVVIVDRNYLQLLGISSSNMRKIPVPRLHTVFLDDVISTEKDQFVKSFNVRDHLYRWTSPQPFPALGFQGGLSGSIVSSRHPLIILMNSASDRQITEGLDMDLFNGNLIFTDRIGLTAAVHNSPKIRNNVVSIDSVSDAAMQEAQSWGAIALQAFVGAILALAIVVLTAIQAAILWAQRKRTRIFVQHTYGYSYWQISSWRILVTVVLLIIGIGIVAALSDMWNTTYFGLPVVAGILVIYGVCAVIADLLACRMVFEHVAHREE